MAGLQIYDTMSRQLETITPGQSGLVRIYCCGPTVYRDAHVGNLRTFLLSDLVVRTLKIRGIKSHLVQNITDVGHMSDDFIAEDKMLSAAQKENLDPFAIAIEYENRYHRDLARLNINPAQEYPRASESIALMQDLIAKLIELDCAYVGSDNTVYFAAQSFLSYGALSGNKLSALKPGHRYEYQEDSDGKKFHADWALWKAAGSRTEMVWPSPWGLGFPGWHIECSAMSLHFLHDHIDLHIGGIDLRFPHHENERAQSNSILRNKEAVSHWMHGEHLLFEGRKMSKSAGNVVLLSDLTERGFDQLALRFCFLENRYRSQMDLSWESIAAANSTLNRWRTKISQWETADSPISSAATELIELIYQDAEDDLDTTRALQRLRSLERDENFANADKASIFLAADEILGLDLNRKPVETTLTTDQSDLLERRSAARAAKDFALSDKLRDELSRIGIHVRDTAVGQEWEAII